MLSNTVLGLKNKTEITKGILGFPGGSDYKESAFNVGDLVRSLVWKDPLEKGKATCSSILAWRVPWTCLAVHCLAKSWTRLSDFQKHFKKEQEQGL